nr:outer membrane beta-barrel protein [Bacteroidota bacterium]
MNNPALKPEKTVDYELGFKQALSRSSAITISAFYREFQDQIQQRRINYAFPSSYVTYDNFDFGTAKGLNFSYDLRRTANVRMTLAYTLQFADGTGSGDASQQELINLGQPNLRTVNPLDFDQRHTLVTTFDYRYGSGADYNGPIWFGKQFFANTGLNVIFRAGSGTPYSALQRIRNEVDNIGLQQSGTGALKGSVNGSRLPWQYRVDLRIDKTIDLKKGKDGGNGSSLNIYLQVLNALNAKNIVAVYRATGNPDDDGFLNSSFAQPQIASATDEQAYRDLYGVMMNNPANYSLPRRIRLGVEFNF